MRQTMRCGRTAIEKPKKALKLKSVLLRLLREGRQSTNEINEALWDLPRPSDWSEELRDQVQRSQFINTMSATSEHQQAMDEQRSAVFGQICKEDTRDRIDAWALHLANIHPLPLGKFPRPRPANRQPPTLKQLGAISDNLRLEWTDEKGGCYIETESDASSDGVRSDAEQSTEVGRLWLESRK
jgi:hypothetical protein